MKRFTLAAVAVASVLMSAPAFAQAQGSDEAADYALSWSAARGGGDYGGVGHAYAHYGPWSHRRHYH